MSVQPHASRRSAWTAAALAYVTCAVCSSAAAQARGDERGRPARAFEHVGTFHVPANLPAGEPITTLTSAEIVDV
ncbi:MAG TPA: hypothetical protein VJR89_36115, partial [Polyangiales bacterium]|nr:hypothetical protein [Polyangiales bacterium]